VGSGKIVVIPGGVAEVPPEMIVAHLPAPVMVATVSKMIVAHRDALMTEKVGDDGGTERMTGTQALGDAMDQPVDAPKVFLIAFLYGISSRSGP
jgi:hypothetical protein